jgi:hypothetical protein
MKKFIAVMVVLMGLMTANSYAGIYGKVEIGIPTNGSYETNYSIPENYKNTFFTNLTLGYKNNLFGIIDYKIFTGIFTWGNREGLKPNGFPFEDIYGIGTEIKYKGLYLQYNHFCAHPVICDSDTGNKYNVYIPDSKSWMSQIESITVGYEFEFK